jgi:hypothetical protein
VPVFFQQQVNDSTRLGIWKIEETEEFFKANVPQHRDVTHPHKRLQHLAGRFLLQYLFPIFLMNSYRSPTPANHFCQMNNIISPSHIVVIMPQQ